jgi:hypothetical protein
MRHTCGLERWQRYAAQFETLRQDLIKDRRCLTRWQLFIPSANAAGTHAPEGRQQNTACPAPSP